MKSYVFNILYKTQWYIGICLYVKNWISLSGMIEALIWWFSSPLMKVVLIIYLHGLRRDMMILKETHYDTFALVPNFRCTLCQRLWCNKQNIKRANLSRKFCLSLTLFGYFEVWSTWYFSVTILYFDPFPQAQKNVYEKMWCNIH